MAGRKWRRIERNDPLEAHFVPETVDRDFSNRFVRR